MTEADNQAKLCFSALGQDSCISLFIFGTNLARHISANNLHLHKYILEATDCRKFAGTDHYISNEKRRQWKPNQKETMSICH